MRSRYHSWKAERPPKLSSIAQFGPTGFSNIDASRCKHVTKHTSTNICVGFQFSFHNGSLLQETSCHTKLSIRTIHPCNYKHECVSVHLNLKTSMTKPDNFKGGEEPNKPSYLTSSESVCNSPRHLPWKSLSPERRNVCPAALSTEIYVASLHRYSASDFNASTRCSCLTNSKEKEITTPTRRIAWKGKLAIWTFANVFGLPYWLAGTG